MTDDLPLIAPDVAAAALHGSFCPKMCNHACPVTAATGRAEAMPWSFHRTVADLAAGRRAAADAASALTYCTGCLGCRRPCTFEQDVPEQVRAGRAAVVAAETDQPADERSVLATTALRTAEDALAAASPYGRDPLDLAGLGAVDATVTLVVGCRDDRRTVEAAVALLSAAGTEVRVATPDGCCGAAVRDLGLPDEADTLRAALGERLAGATVVLALDPHCLPELREAAPDADVRHVLGELERRTQAGALTFDGGLGPVTYHDPCLLARQERLVQEPRTLLAAAGAEIVEPEGHGADTACSGAGLGLEALDAEAAEAVSRRRRAQLDATTAPTVVTACAGARARLGADGTTVHDLIQILADHLTGQTT